MAINKVMVLGAGTMGMGIAQVFAEAGKTVIVRDIADAFIQRGEGVLKKNMEKKVAKGKITEEQKNETLGRVSFTLELANKIASKAQVAIRAAKQAVRYGIQCDISTAATYEALAFATCFGTEDQKDAMKAFVEKKKLDGFKNR